MVIFTVVFTVIFPSTNANAEEDSTPPNSPAVNEVTDKSISISGTAEAGSTITVKAGMTVLGTATTTSEGKYTVTIPEQEAGTILSVTATDDAGNISEAKDITVKDVTTSEIYKEWESKQNVPINKVWTVKFNYELDETTISNESIFIQHNQQNIEGIKISLNEDKKSVKVEAPVEGYKKGEKYILYIEKGIKSVTGKTLNTPVKFEFTIEQELDSAFTIVNNSELNNEQKQLIEKWKETKGVYCLDDLYIITAGALPNPSYGLEIVKTETSWEQVKVYVRVTELKQDGVSYPEVISYPYIIGKLNLPPYTSLLFVDAETGETIPIKNFTTSNQLSIIAYFDEEAITITNHGTSNVNMTGWTLVSVEGNQIYTFPDGFVLNKGASVKITSGPNAENQFPTHLKWTDGYICNNDGDIAELYNSEGEKVSEYR